jgi:homoserine kinase type II
MAVYTRLDAEDLADIVARYDVGNLISAKGIAEGISNSNWLIETERGGQARGRYVLTMYERRIDPGELPYFLGLLDHLAAHGCPVPATVHTRQNHRGMERNGKSLALIEYLPGVSPGRPTPSQASHVGRALAQMHIAGRDYPARRANPLGADTWQAMLGECGERQLAGIEPSLPAMVEKATRLREAWPRNLPMSVCHTDLFPDNVLMLGDRVSGLIDFYFACDEMMAYDLAVAHAAWSFDGNGSFRREVGDALVTSYHAERPLTEAERASLPLLAQGATMRFIASRAADWLDTPGEALVRRKHPAEFVERFRVYEREGARAFPSLEPSGTGERE